MTGKIFRYSFLVGVLVLILCAGLFFGLQYRQNLDNANETLRQETAYVAQGLRIGGERYLQQLPPEKRVTWMDGDGNVLYDSQRQNLPNQGELEEVSSAIRDGSGRATRTSGSGGVTTMYYAQLLEDGTIVRLSLPVSAVRSALITVSPVLWIFILALTISGVLSFRAAKQIVRPINMLDLDRPEQEKTYPELAPLVSRLQEQRLTIDEQLETLHLRQKEFSALTENMAEGFLLLDSAMTVLSVNASALFHLPQAEVGQPLTGQDERTGTALKSALEGTRSEVRFQTEGRSWQLIASPVFSRSQLVGAVLIWMDVTEQEQREQLRKEFSANVSHELKTPLTSISGFAELMAQGSVPSETVVDFSRNILREAQRMIALIDDIMRLSKLDEDVRLPPMESVELTELCRDVIDSLQSTAEQKDVSLSLEGEETTVTGIWQMLSEMVYNLVDNAIKYNRQGGSVKVTVSHENGQPVLSVEDTGIGIPEAEQGRVFERFYRVDKSHSKQIGGTGLGLSIVKHGAQLHDARLVLRSTPGTGTEVTLCFPRPADKEVAEATE